MTHSHALDFDLALAALARDDWRYVGMIGSKAKRAQFERRVAERGLAADVAARVTCPIGATIRGDLEQGAGRDRGCRRRRAPCAARTRGSRSHDRLVTHAW